MEWQIQQADGFDAQFHRFDKKHKPEAAALLRNLDKYFGSLREGTNPLQIKAGFIHGEQKGVKALDQSGCETSSPMQSRLYVYPETDKCLLHVICIGTKTNQGSDVKAAADYVTRLRKKD